MQNILAIAIGVLVVAVIALIVVVMHFRKPGQTSYHMPKEYRKEYGSFYYGLEEVNIKHDDMKDILAGLRKHIVGMDSFLHGLLLALLAGGHVLVEGAPGLAKTKTIRLLSSLLALDTKRIQFTPDMLPADLIGVDMFNPSTHVFETFFGPLFTNILLADEINRATPKLQSALLEAMQEKQVSIGGKSYPLSAPFFVLATQNPIEQDGTYPLPEAQLDRFMMKLSVGYPSVDVEKQILEASYKDDGQTENILSAEKIIALQHEVSALKADDDITKYIVQLVGATRDSEDTISYGASPRGSLAVLSLAKALAFLEGREEVLKKDVQRVVLPALRHRIILSVKAQMNNRKDVDVLFDAISPLW